MGVCPSSYVLIKNLDVEVHCTVNSIVFICLDIFQIKLLKTESFLSRAVSVRFQLAGAQFILILSML